jgi:Uma2 family endonuclease
VRPAVAIGDDALYDLCAANPDLRIERTADGELLIMSPTGGETGARNARLTAQLVAWADRDATGIVFDSSTGFLLPNGAERAPDAAWIRSTRWDALSPEQRKRLVPLCPDFVLELLSPSDRLEEQQERMREYLANGTVLGWLSISSRSRLASAQSDARHGCWSWSVLRCALGARSKA